jgi:hypothetical protein
MSEISFPPPAPHRQLEAHAAAQRWVRKLRILYTVAGVYVVLSLMWFAIDMADGTENSGSTGRCWVRALSSPSSPSCSSASADCSEWTGSAGGSIGICTRIPHPPSNRPPRTLLP